MNEIERGGATALRGSCTQTPDLGARSGVWDDMGRMHCGRNGRIGATAFCTDSPSRNEKRGLELLYGGQKNRSNNLARVIYSDPRSRSEKGDLERQRARQH